MWRQRMLGAFSWWIAIHQPFNPILRCWRPWRHWGRCNLWRCWTIWTTWEPCKPMWPLAAQPTMHMMHRVPCHQCHQARPMRQTSNTGGTGHPGQSGHSGHAGQPGTSTSAAREQSTSQQSTSQQHDHSNTSGVHLCFAQAVLLCCTGWQLFCKCYSCLLPPENHTSTVATTPAFPSPLTRSLPNVARLQT